MGILWASLFLHFFPTEDFPVFVSDVLNLEYLNVEEICPEPLEAKHDFFLDSVIKSAGNLSHFFSVTWMADFLYALMVLFVVNFHSQFPLFLQPCPESWNSGSFQCLLFFWPWPWDCSCRWCFMYNIFCAQLAMDAVAMAAAWWEGQGRGDSAKVLHIGTHCSWVILVRGP